MSSASQCQRGPVHTWCSWLCFSANPCAPLDPSLCSQGRSHLINLRIPLSTYLLSPSLQPPRSCRQPLVALTRKIPHPSRALPSRAPLLLRGREPSLAAAILSTVHPFLYPDFSRVIGALTPKRTVMHPILVKIKLGIAWPWLKVLTSQLTSSHLISPTPSTKELTT